MGRGPRAHRPATARRLRAPAGHAVQVRSRPPGRRRQRARAARPRATEVTPESSMGDLAYAVLRRQLAVLRDKEPGTRLGEDPEELHDMRVATRRLRAALDLFVERAAGAGPVLPGRARLAGRRARRRARPRCAARSPARDGRRGERLGHPARPGRRRGSAGRPDRHCSSASARPPATPCWPPSTRSAGTGSSGGLAAMVQQGPLRRSTATRLPAAMAVPELVVRPPWRRGQGGQAGQAAPAWRPTSTACASAASACATRSSSAPSSTSGRTSRYTQPADRAAESAGPDAGREVAATRLADAGHRRGPPAAVHRLHHGRGGRAPPPRDGPHTGRGCPARWPGSVARPGRTC